MRFVRKPIDPIELTKLPLVVLALMFECDPRVEMKEGWEKRVGAIRCCRNDGRRRNQAGHLRMGNGRSCTIIKEMVYGRSVLSSKESDTLTGKGMSITVPDTSMLVTGSIRSTRVPGG
jgi:hypothetical protein